MAFTENFQLVTPEEWEALGLPRSRSYVTFGLAPGKLPQVVTGSSPTGPHPQTASSGATPSLEKPPVASTPAPTSTPPPVRSRRR
jgi:hypothetical protein